MPPRHGHPLAAREEPVREDTEEGEADDAHHELGRVHDVARVKDEEADARVGRDHLSGDEEEQSRARAELEPGEDHGQGRGQDDLADDAPPPRPEGDGSAHEERVRLAHSRVGVDGHGEEDAEGDDGDLGRLPEAEPEDEQREEGDLGDGEGRRDERLAHRLRAREESRDDAYRHARPRAQGEAQQQAAQARPQMNEKLARRRHLAELPDDPERRGHEQGGNDAHARQHLPEHEETHERAHAEQAVIGSAQEGSAIADGHAFDGHQPRPSTSAAWACDLISPHMRSEACTNPSSPISPSWRGRLSSTGTISRTRPGRRDSTTTRSAMYTASWMLWVT